MTAGPFDIFELMLRSGAAALNLLLAAQFLRVRPFRFVTAAGALFSLSVAVYALVSHDWLPEIPGVPGEALELMAVAVPAFFWWFGIALFRDAFAWRWIYAAPLLLLLFFHGLRHASNENLHVAGGLLHETTLALLMIHIVSLAVSDLRNDLVDARRRFRVAISLLLPLAGIVIAIAETYEIFGALPAWLGLLHALMLIALSSLFALWLTATKPELFAAPQAEPQPAPEPLSPAEAIELARLKAAIGNGICFEPELSLGALAGKLGIPEHRLRKLVGKGLGFRNFAAFLNDHRVAEAKRRLADPARAREQIIAIAFGLGYSSLAPFNRAFREATGTTPSEFRAAALARVIDSEKDRSKAEISHRFISRRDAGCVLRQVFSGTPRKEPEMTNACFNPAALPGFVTDIYPLILQNDLYRYLIGAGGTFLVVNTLLAGWLAKRKIREETPGWRQIGREILASLRTVLIFSLVGLSIAVLVRLGLLPVYENPAERGWPYFALNVIMLIVGHDAWFYWTHRLMHRPRLFRWFHTLHHRSYNPTPWTSYAFDVGEAVVNAIYLPLAMMIMPTSVLAAFIFTGHMMLRNAIGHCGYEVFPARADGRPLLGWLTAVTHHDLHHARARTNFGFYFTFWDRVMGTEDPEYHARFARAVGRPLKTAARPETAPVAAG